MEFIAKIFRNSKTGQGSLIIPKKQLLKTLKVEKMPEVVKVKITECKRNQLIKKNVRLPNNPRLI